ncbi:hypothetical protein DTO271G3_4009 [Paecilomyces variotii]|nr:hypothetical protein DTO271G3_4009 [Paecilomyces variotii]
MYELCGPRPIIEKRLPSYEFRQGLLDASCKGDLRRVHALFEILKEDNLAESSLYYRLLTETARNGQADVLRYLFDTLSDCLRPLPWNTYNYQFCLPFNYHEDNLHGNDHTSSGVVNVPLDALEGTDPPAIINVLFDYGLTGNHDLGSNMSLLYKAVEMKKHDVVKLLLDHGADINRQKPELVLIGAIKSDDPDMVSLLVKHGALTEESKAFDYALTNRRIRSVGRLLELGADINGTFAMRRSRNGKLSKVRAGTPLHRVIMARPKQPEATCSLEEMIRFLLEKGANADIVNSTGKTPLQLARHKKRKEVIKIFKEFGVKK